MTYQEFRDAVEVFGLGTRATMAQIKARHRQLVREHHPDRAPGGEPGAIRRINSAHKTLLDYCSSYHFCFSEEEFLEQTPAERLRRQFEWDPLCSGAEEAEDR